MKIKRYIKPLLTVLLPLIILYLPRSIFQIESMTVVEHRIIAIFCFAAISWVLEPIPIYATSLVIVTLLLITVSDRGLFLFQNDGLDVAEFGKVLSYKDIFATFGSPIILLFMGGFFLAMAATKYKLDVNLARIILKPFGKKPINILLGVMLVTAIFSMFMSNTATTAMMLSILAPIITMFPTTDKGRIAFALSIPFAANIGGIGTPIGTPPNAVAMKYLTGNLEVSFGEWMSFGVPYTIALLMITWLLLYTIFPTHKSEIDINIKGRFIRNRKAYIVYVTFVATILLWLTTGVHQMSSYVVAMIPVVVFLSLDIINKQDIKNISWDVLWLVSGGIALGLALKDSNLAKHLVTAIPFGSFSPLVIIIFVVLLSVVMANFMSNTATANLLLPLIIVIGDQTPDIANIYGAKSFVIVTAVACSLGMIMPISTPPNALAHSTGLIQTKEMAKAGMIIAVIGIGMLFGLLYML